LVYALEKVISHARKTGQIFVAQCVWWLASIIGLEQGLIIYIDNLHSRVKVLVNPEEPQAKPTPPPEESSLERQDHVLSIGRTVSPVPREIQEHPRLSPEEDWIHPERRKQVDSTNLHISNLDLNDSHKDPQSEVIESSRVSLVESKKESKEYNKQKRDRLAVTRSGRIRAKPLTAGQRKYLQCLLRDTIAEYLADRK
jgi:hypothetical protein